MFVKAKNNQSCQPFLFLRTNPYVSKGLCVNAFYDDGGFITIVESRQRVTCHSNGRIKNLFRISTDRFFCTKFEQACRSNSTDVRNVRSPGSHSECIKLFLIVSFASWATLSLSIFSFWNYVKFDVVICT